MVWLLNGYLFLIKRQAQDRHLWVVFNRGGAEGARGAHNSEVRCSNHLSGISNLCFLDKCVIKVYLVYYQIYVFLDKCVIKVYYGI